MKITFDDQYLITVSEDAVLMIWKISDKEGRALAKRDKEVGYAEEILITKSDLEEKVRRLVKIKKTTTMRWPLLWNAWIELSNKLHSVCWEAGWTS